MNAGFDPAAAWDRWTDEDIQAYGIKDPTSAAAFLAKRCGGGRALELGPGAGHVAIALADLGTPVVALDISEKMCARIDHNRGTRPVTAIVGDMTNIDVNGQFDLIYSTTSTIFSLLTQEEQVTCFASMARVLVAGGKAVVQASAPLRRGSVLHRTNLAVRDFGDECLGLSATTHNPATQRVTFREITIANGQPASVLPVETRYAFPSELDLMARLAGLRLLDRFGGWDERVYDASSVQHVSVYGRA